MKTFVYLDSGNDALEDRPKPALTASTDAIVKITKTTICGTDLHILKGDVPTCQPGRILGHEGVGVIDSIGAARGKCVLVGLSPGEFPVPLFDVANCITVRGSFVGARQDMAEALPFAAEGKVKADIELQPLSAINRVFQRFEHGDVPSRVALDFARA